MRKFVTGVLIVLFMLLSSISARAVVSTDVKVISNGYTFFMVKSDSSVLGWGRNTNGELGIGNTENQLSPFIIPELTNVKDIIKGENGVSTFFALKTDDTVLAWGDNQYGQLGTGSTADQSVPVTIPNLTDISQIVTDGYTVYAIDDNGDVFAWGRNNYGQVGNNRTNNQMTPVQITELSNIKEIICKNSVAYSIDNDGNVFAWGRASSGQIGIYSYISARKTPYKIAELSDVDRIITNGNTTYAICKDGQEIYGWGANNYGQVGCSGTINRMTPGLISGISDVVELIIKFKTTYALLSDGTLYGWGHNSYGQLANDGSSIQGSPRLISGIPPVKQIISNGYSTCVLCTNNSVYAWGYNSYGGVGNGMSGGSQKTPYKINSLRNTSKIAGEDYTFYAIKEDGTVYGWGKNGSGQAGVGTTGTQRTPALIEITDIEVIQVFDNTVLAVDAHGYIYGWGANNYGQLAIGTTDNECNPVIIHENELALTTATGTGDVNSTVPIAGTINALTISITHTVNVAYSINTNSEEGFYCTDIQITNNSKVPVKVGIEAFVAGSGGDLVFQDVLPESMDWNNLNKQDTKSYIALGLQYVDESEWLISQPELIEPLYAAEIDNTYIGSLDKYSSGTLELCGWHGLAFDGDYTSMHQLIFVISLL